MLTFAIGDIHGRADLLELALAEIATFEGEKLTIFLGDYVDRGPDSCAVIERLIGLDPANHIFLMGNHETLMLDYLLNGQHYMWDINGGAQTLDSYQGKVPLAHIEWLQDLRYYYEDKMGRVFVHAGIDPRHSLAEQEPETLVWIRDIFLDHGGLPYYVVHGHTHTHRNKRMAEVENLPHRCNLDTAAYYTGFLSIAVFNDRDVQPERIIQVCVP